MYWNHRVIETEECGEVYQAIYEVYYDDDGLIAGWADSPSPILKYEGETWEEVLMQRVVAALSKPVLVGVVAENGKLVLKEK